MKHYKNITRRLITALLAITMIMVSSGCSNSGGGSGPSENPQPSEIVNKEYIPDTEFLLPSCIIRDWDKKFCFEEVRDMRGDLFNYIYVVVAITSNDHEERMKKAYNYYKEYIDTQFPSQTDSKGNTISIELKDTGGGFQELQLKVVFPE